MHRHTTSAVIDYNLDSETAAVQQMGSHTLVAAKKTEDVYLDQGNATIRRLDDPSFVLHGHATSVDSLALSPDETLLASGGDHVIRLWDTTSGNCRQILSGHAARVQSLAFAPQGGTLASASFDGTIKLWDSHSATRPPLEINACIPEGFSLQRALVLSADLQYLAVLTDYNVASIYKTDDHSLVGKLQLQAPTGGLQFLGDRPVLFGLAIESPREIAEWDVAQWRIRRQVIPGRSIRACTPFVSVRARSNRIPRASRSSVEPTGERWQLRSSQP